MNDYFENLEIAGANMCKAVEILHKRSKKDVSGEELANLSVTICNLLNHHCGEFVEKILTEQRQLLCEFIKRKQPSVNELCRLCVALDTTESLLSDAKLATAAHSPQEQP